MFNRCCCLQVLPFHQKCRDIFCPGIGAHDKMPLKFRATIQTQFIQNCQAIAPEMQVVRRLISFSSTGCTRSEGLRAAIAVPPRERDSIRSREVELTLSLRAVGPQGLRGRWRSAPVPAERNMGAAGGGASRRAPAGCAVQDRTSTVALPTGAGSEWTVRRHSRDLYACITHII